MNELELSMALKLCEEKLKKYMTQEEYAEFVRYVAKQVFKATVNGMADGEFKEFCKQNFDMITE